MLTDKQKAILNRILSPATDKISWYQSLSYIILDKQLDNLIDEEEAYLIDNLIHLFKELDKYIDISRKNLAHEDNFIRIEMISMMEQYLLRLYASIRIRLISRKK